jgi:hypothetical protein
MNYELRDEAVRKEFVSVTPVGVEEDNGFSVFYSSITPAGL